MAVNTVELNSSGESEEPVNNLPDPCCDIGNEDAAYKLPTDPLALEGVFVALIKTIYQDPDCTKTYGAKPYISNKDVNSVFIDVHEEQRKGQVERHAGIYIEVAELKVDNYRYNGIGSRAGTKPETGAVELNHGLTGVLRIHHVGRISGNAKVYACTTFNTLRQFSYAIKKELCFEKFDVTSIVKPSQGEDIPGEWNSVVTVTFEFIDSWCLEPTTVPLLKQVELHMQDYCTKLIRTETIVK